MIFYKREREYTILFFHTNVYVSIISVIECTFQWQGLQRTNCVTILKYNIVVLVIVTYHIRVFLILKNSIMFQSTNVRSLVQLVFGFRDTFYRTKINYKSNYKSRNHYELKTFKTFISNFPMVIFPHIACNI